MKKKSKPLEFLEAANKDPKIGLKIFKAVEKGNMLMAKEVVEIARQLGYTFSREEFETDVKKDIEARFAAGDISVASAISKKFASDAPESACSKGCLSYTVSWHPDPDVLKQLGKPVER
jgi:hypothetical protein